MSDPINIINNVRIDDGVNTPIDADLGAAAEHVTYDNTDSGLTATDAQGAFDEISGIIKELVAQGNYAECTTAIDVAAKTANITNFDLGTNVQVVIKFVYGNSAANPTLNISNTGAKSILIPNASDTKIKAGSVFLVSYDGTNYVLVGGAGGSMDGFIGTQNEWESLSVSEKAEYEGKLVIITDDYTGSTTPGHRIENSSGTTMDTRASLQFGDGFSVTDDSVNDRTVVNVDIGTQLTNYKEVTAPTGGIVKGASVNLTPGKWIIIIQAVYKTSSSAGVRNIGYEIDSGGNISILTVPGCDEWDTLTGSNIVSISSACTVYVAVSQSTGSTCGVITGISATRLI